jgi:SPP1 gp7 family putative phage head morphogenesis protein
MPINPQRLNKTLSQSEVVHGIKPLTASIEATKEVVQSYVMGKWVMALNAAMAAVPEPEKAKDSAADVARIVSSVFNNYSGLTTLNERLKSRYETDDKYHREQFIRDINRAVGVNVKDLLNERGSAAVIKTRLVESMDLIKTLDRDLVKRLTSEVWAGIQRGDDALSIKRFILEEKSGYPRWRADLIARDQTNKLFSQLTEERQTDIGVETYIWEITDDGAVRDTHYERKDKEYRWDSDDIKPGEEIQCRCVAGMNTAIIKRALGIDFGRTPGETLARRESPPVNPSPGEILRGRSGAV